MRNKHPKLFDTTTHRQKPRLNKDESAAGERALVPSSETQGQVVGQLSSTLNTFKADRMSGWDHSGCLLEVTQWHTTLPQVNYSPISSDQGSVPRSPITGLVQD